MTYTIKSGPGLGTLYVRDGGVWKLATMAYLSAGGGSPLGSPMKELYERVSYSSISDTTTWARRLLTTANAPTEQPTALTITAANLSLSKGVTLGWTESTNGLSWTLVLNFTNDTDPSYNTQFVLAPGRSNATQLYRPCGSAGDVVEFNAAYQDADNSVGPVSTSSTFTIS